MSSRRLKNWKIMPTWRRRNRAAPASDSMSTRSSPTRTAPLVGRSIPAMRLSSVDLPLPDGPMMATALTGLDAQGYVIDGGRGRTVIALCHVL